MLNMKVLHLISGGDTGGAKTHLISLMKGLEGKIDAKVICFIEDTFYRDLEKEGIDIEVFQQSSRFDLSVISRLQKEIEENSYDILHCHGARANFIAMFLKSKINIPIVTTIHSDYKLDFKDNFLKKIIFTPLNVIALKSFKYYIAISDQFKEMLIERGFKADKIFVSYNGIDLDSEVNYMPKDSFLKKYKIDYNGEVLLAIVARLDEVKDHDTFIKMAEKVLSKDKNFKFLIAGNGQREEELKAKVKDKKLEDYIHFLGFVENPYDIFNAIDINVLTSKSESFPYSILEGAKLKKTILSTRVGGLSKLVKDDHNGYLVDVGDYEGMADKVLALGQDEVKIKTMGENLYKTVEENYSSDSMAESHIEIYKKILKVED